MGIMGVLSPVDSLLLEESHIEVHLTAFVLIV